MDKTAPRGDADGINNYINTVSTQVYCILSVCDQNHFRIYHIKSTKLKLFIGNLLFKTFLTLNIRTAGNIHLLKLMGTSKLKHVKLRKNVLKDTVELDLIEVTMTSNDTKIKLTSSVTSASE